MTSTNQWQALCHDIQPYLCPAGDGVYTVSTGQQQKQSLQQLLYGATDKQQVADAWQQHLQQQPTAGTPLILGVCSDSGGGIQRGANWGPLYLRQALYDHISKQQLYDLGDVRVIPHLLLDDYLNEQTLNRCRQALYDDGNSPRAVSPLSITEAVTTSLYETLPDTRLLAFGGDHSVSYPLTKSYLKAKQRQGINCAILHFDAHTDLLPRRLGIDICFGSWSYHILQYLSSPAQLIQIGIRASGKDKAFWQNSLGITQYWAKEVKAQGATQIGNTILQQLQQQQVTELYVTVDIDALDQRYASATGTAEPNGLSPNDITTILDIVGASVTISSADLMEVAPFVQVVQNQNEPATTLSSAVKILDNLIHHLRY